MVAFYWYQIQCMVGSLSSLTKPSSFLFLYIYLSSSCNDFNFYPINISIVSMNFPQSKSLKRRKMVLNLSVLNYITFVIYLEKITITYTKRSYKRNSQIDINL